MDPSGRVSSQGLQQWSPQSSLAAVVVETISLLTGGAPPGQARLSSPTGKAQQRYQPRFGMPLCEVQTPHGHFATPLAHSKAHFCTGTADGGQQARPSVSPLPSVPQSFPALQHATTESLHLALVDDREYRSVTVSSSGH